MLIPNTIGSCYKLLVIFQGFSGLVFLKYQYKLSHIKLMSVIVYFKTETAVVYVYGLHV